MAATVPRTPPTPQAEKIPTVLTKFGDKRIDNYYWLRERENPKVKKYLEAENSYVDSELGHTKDFQLKLFHEMKTRIKEDDQTVPIKIDNYYYYTRVETGKEYTIYCRKKNSLDSPEEIILDVNEKAKGHDYFRAVVEISDDHRILAYAADTEGRRLYTIRFIDLEKKTEFSDVIKNITENFEWAADNRTIFYTLKDATTLRAHKLFRYTLGTPTPEFIKEEKDDTFRLGISKSRSLKYLFIISESTLSTEYSYIEADRPKMDAILFQKRSKKLEYSIEDGGDRFYILTNFKAKNFRVMEVAKDKTALKNWQEVIPHRTTHYLEDLDIFKNHFVLQEKNKGRTLFEVVSRADNKKHFVTFKDSSYEVSPEENPNYDTARFRYGYSSLNTPTSIFDHDLITKTDALLKVKEIPGGFNSDDYATEWIWAKAKDGIKVPISVVYKKTTKLNGSAPLYIDGYGSYGLNNDPYFHSSWITLLERGFVCAIAHIRGGAEMGREWYETGKFLKKKNTFNDFIAATEHLIKIKYAHPKKVYAYGASAGGILMGYISNARPDLYNGILAGVPFVDVLTTMLDDSIPLTTSEYDEWGDPNKKEYYKYMKSYSPYDNVKKQDYPNILVQTGFHDSQVQYWEPAKWIAKLRELKTDKNRLLFKTQLNQGHSGASGRFEALKDKALEFAFIFDLEGIHQ